MRVCVCVCVSHTLCIPERLLVQSLAVEILPSQEKGFDHISLLVISVDNNNVCIHTVEPF